MTTKTDNIPVARDFHYDCDDEFPACCGISVVSSFWAEQDKDFRLVPDAVLKQISANFDSYKTKLTAATIVAEKGRRVSMKQPKKTPSQWGDYYEDEDGYHQAVANYILPRTGWRRVGRDWKHTTGNTLRLWVREKPEPKPAKRITKRK